jgi:diguanylate cyclase (GGDEF)-like protein
MSNRSDGGPESDAHPTHGRVAGAHDGRPPLRNTAPRQHDPRTPYRVLVQIMLACGLFAILFGALPTHDDSVRLVDVVVATVLAVAGLLVWFVLPRIRDDVGLDIAIVFGAVVAGCCTSLIRLQESQFLIAFGLAGLGVFAAYFRPRRRLILLLVIMTVSFAVGVALNPLLPTPTSYIVAVLMIWGMALMVSMLVEQLRAQAMYDSLTGTLNRRGLDVAVASVAANAARSGQSITVALLDLDGFKSYNDEHGHIAGDELLTELSAAWLRELRAGDILARYGGDEFALVLPFSTRDEADDVARRLRAAHPALWSVGFADWAPGENLYEAFDRADESLYSDKRGRDRRVPLPEIS